MTDVGREKLLKALIEIGQELASTVELEAILDRILQISRELFGFENAIIRLLDPDNRQLVTAASYGYPAAACAVPILYGQGVMGRVAETRQPLLLHDLTESTDYVPGIIGARSELAVPLLVRDKLVGVFNLESPRPHAFSEEDIPPLLTMASQAAIALENARLYQNLRTVSARFQRLHHLNERILHSASIGIYTVDAKLVITSWNRKMEELSCVDESEALGCNLFSLFPGLEQEGFADRVKRVLETGTPEKLRLSHRNLHGELRFQKRRLTPLIDQGVTTGVVVLVEDITEFKHLLEQTIQSEKLVEVGRLSAALAHEVNNPLAVIAYAAQLLRREDNLTPFQQEMAERIETEIERLKALTGSLLSFSQAREPVKRLTSLNEVLHDVLRLVRFELSRKGVVLQEDFGQIPLVTVDSNKLKQVFINLATNAVHALAGGGTLRISTTVVAATGEVEVAFADNGPGIPANLHKKIFEPFFSTKREGEGTGLGLYICRNLVAEHQGRLTLDSQPGQGACFRVLLPQACTEPGSTD